MTSYSAYSLEPELFDISLWSVICLHICHTKKNYNRGKLVSLNYQFVQNILVTETVLRSPSCQNAKAMLKPVCFYLFLIFIFKDVLESSFQVCNQSNYQMCKQNIALANHELYKFSSVLPHIQQNPCPQRDFLS